MAVPAWRVIRPAILHDLLSCDGLVIPGCICPASWARGLNSTRFRTYLAGEQILKMLAQRAEMTVHYLTPLCRWFNELKTCEGVDITRQALRNALSLALGTQRILIVLAEPTNNATRILFSHMERSQTIQEVYNLMQEFSSVEPRSVPILVDPGA